MHACMLHHTHPERNSSGADLQIQHVCIGLYKERVISTMQLPIVIEGAREPKPSTRATNVTMQSSLINSQDMHSLHSACTDWSVHA